MGASEEIAAGLNEAPAAAFAGKPAVAAAPRRPDVDIPHLPNLAIADPERLLKQIRLNRAMAKGTFAPAGAGGGTLERVLGENNMLPFYVLELGNALGRAVCKITVRGRSGTGFLVGPDLLLTNNHVLESVEDAKAAWCIFDYQLGPDRKERETISFKLDPDGLFLTSPFAELPGGRKDGLDYTFVRIDKAACQRFGTIRMSRGGLGVVKDELANIVHHPNGGLKHITLQDNRVTSDDGIYLRYRADTEPGSSGSPVFNNDWQLIALHHASWPDGADFVNEGVKLSAIAVDVERRTQVDGEAAAAREVLKAFQDTDSLLGGYFGGLGRRSRETSSPSERVVDIYAGEADDIDVGFWNVEWFTKRWREQERLDAVARLVIELNLDVYALSESSPEAAGRLADFVRQNYGFDFAVGSSEPEAPEGKQSTTVLWNTRTVAGERLEWPDEVRPWFELDSRQLPNAGAEAVHGKVFDRYPGLFRFRALGREGKRPFDFFLVPLHLKAMAEGRLRRRMAAQILGAAIKKMVDAGEDADWIVGGDYNAELATGDFMALFEQGMVPISAEDEKDGAMTYLKNPKSLIDHIFLSPNLVKSFNTEDFFIYAADKSTPEYVEKVSDHRPVLVRLSLAAAGGGAEATREGLPDDLANILGKLGSG